MTSAVSSWILGINLSGAEDGNASTGVMYWNYIYPTNQEIDHYALEGAKVIRIPISMERLQPTPNGALDAVQLSYIDALVAHAAADGLQIILDPHNYGYTNGVEIGSTVASNTAFADFWSKMAAHYASNPNVIFGLMNEPHTQNGTEWLTSANLAISAIRHTGATQEILVPGTSWDTAATWLQSGNAAALANGVIDPAHNYAIEVHQYFDSDSSGTHANVVSATIGAERLQAVTQWAESTGNRLFLGEFGAASDSLSLQALSNTLTYMQAHSDVWQGGTYWASGPWMSSYMFSTETPAGTDTPQMTVLRGFTSLPVQTVAPITSATTATVTTLLVTPTTTAAPTSWPTPDETSNEANPLVAQKMQTYRFFDTESGTQFLTSDLKEVATIIATRPDLKYEGYGLTAINSARNDPDAVMVSRFFDINNGTHFYTTNESEKAQIIATRADLVLEEGGFFEHNSQQQDDIPVYRFFESQTGDHFYTSSTNEKSTILAGRPDMLYEGVAFFAPTAP